MAITQQEQHLESEFLIFFLKTLCILTKLQKTRVKGADYMSIELSNRERILEEVYESHCPAWSQKLQWKSHMNLETA